MALNLKERFNKFAFIEDGGKHRFNIQKIGGLVAFIFCSLYGIFAFFFDTPPTGISKKTERSIISNQDNNKASQVANQEIPTFQVQEVTSPSATVQKNTRTYSGQSKLVFRAKQVLERVDDKNGRKTLPTGTNLIGKLLTAIDSRDTSSPVRVLLPYGGKFQDEEVLEKNTTLMGRANFSGKGERIFITFDRAISPTGQERSIMANVLDSSDYSNGLIGDVHTETGMRIAGTLGLTMIASVSDVLTEKTAYGQSGVVLPKANMRNAAFQGVSKVSEMEASRQMDSIAQAQPYVTVEAGTDLIVTLGALYGDENEQQQKRE